jgi:DNA-binding XRE family transcriptional regulator
MREDKQKLAAMIRANRDRSGFNKKAFAEKLGVSRRFIDMVEHADPPSNLELLLRMIDVLNPCNKIKAEATRLVYKVCPRKWQSRKHHLRVGILKQRSRR